MLPTLWPGEVLAIEAQSFDRVQVGDVVLFAREDRFYIHRILRKDKTAVGNRLIGATRCRKRMPRFFLKNCWAR